MSLSRRQVLQGIGLLTASALLSPLQRASAQVIESALGQTLFNTPASALEPNPVTLYADLLPSYLEAMGRPYDAPLNIQFERVVGRNNIGLLLYDLKRSRLVTSLAPENPLPVASAFKGPVLAYFLDTVDGRVWKRVPVAYWNAVQADQVPYTWRDDWRANQAILQALYQMIVVSDNVATGAVLSYAARAQDSTEPLVLFNDWARDRVGISQLSALSSWNSGIDAGMSAVDPRYTERTTSVNGQTVTFENLMTPRDMGLFYLWIASRMSWLGMRFCRDLLSIIRDNRGANLERLAQAFDATPYSKNGSLITDDGTIITDAGLIRMPGDGPEYVLVMLSMGDTTVIPTLFDELRYTLEGRYNELIHNHHYNAITNEELTEIYVAQLGTTYPAPESVPAHTGQFRYGFIVPEGVQVYASPDETQPLHNPVIRSTRFGIHLLMQGALARYVDVNADWVELMPDDHRDNVRSRLGTRLFVKRPDVWPIALDHSTPITSLHGRNIGADDKFIIINLVARQLIAMENATPVLHVPIVLNEEATPRGVQVITSKWFARSMQPWAPGVPFTAFFGAEGFAIHGSPWQRWITTVNQGNIAGRTSAGCVNIPDWLVQSGEYVRPADELLFRWIGGMENAHDRVFDYPTEAFPALRIFSVDYLHNLHSYNRPQALARVEASWGDVLDAIENTPLQAPGSFFIEA